LDGKYAVLRIKQILIVNNKVDLIKAEVELNVFPFIIKPNRSGKGTGIKLYNNLNN
jgi:glutathione synthase/RimK-type ligase-like ATP-grasp enzyme